MAMTLNLGALTGNAYLNVFLSGATEIPSAILVMFVMIRFGRIKTFIMFGSFFALCNAIAIPLELIPGMQTPGLHHISQKILVTSRGKN